MRELTAYIPQHYELSDRDDPHTVWLYDSNDNYVCDIVGIDIVPNSTLYLADDGTVYRKYESRNVFENEDSV